MQHLEPSILHGAPSPPLLVSAVDEWCRPVLNLYIRQELPVVSYLTPLTGITRELLDAYAVPQAEALASLR
ncbi:hypothetical protein EON63_12570 [archaeon]|nr:MAG: hypothetical protein EON63_12570 [archaeon]